MACPTFQRGQRGVGVGFRAPKERAGGGVLLALVATPSKDIFFVCFYKPAGLTPTRLFSSLLFVLLRVVFAPTLMSTSNQAR